ncbi:MAG: FAD-binding oxidoreductase [Saprospiraceae bacterium]|nr:FAD-binding oxidoreductase [Saprospiraceae bacterium]
MQITPQQWSFWEKDLYLQGIDVTVLGAGIVGLSTAIFLKQLRPSWKIQVLDQWTLGGGATTRNAGFACFGSPTELLSDLTNQDEETTFQLVQARWNGLQLLQQTIDIGLADYTPCGGYELFFPEDAEAWERVEKQLPYFNLMTKSVTGVDHAYQVLTPGQSKLPFHDLKQVVYMHHEARIHPGKMHQLLVSKAIGLSVPVIRGIEVEHLHTDGEMVQLTTPTHGILRTRQVVVATNGFTPRLLPDLDIRPARNQVLVTEPLPDIKWDGTFHYQEGYVYFRRIGQRILLGGMRHIDRQAEMTDNLAQTTVIQEALEHFLRHRLLNGRDVRITDRWSGILGVGGQKLPILQRVAPNVIVAARLGGMGVALGTGLGRQAAELTIS